MKKRRGNLDVGTVRISPPHASGLILRRNRHRQGIAGTSHPCGRPLSPFQRFGASYRCHAELVSRHLMPSCQRQETSSRISSAILHLLEAWRPIQNESIEIIRWILSGHLPSASPNSGSATPSGRFRLSACHRPGQRRGREGDGWPCQAFNGIAAYPGMAKHVGLHHGFERAR